MPKKFHVGDYVIRKTDSPKFPYGFDPIQIQHINEYGNLFFDDDLAENNGGWCGEYFSLWDDSEYQQKVASCRDDLLFAINNARDIMANDKKLIKILKRKIKEIKECIQSNN